jgi:hypothetical protein
MQGLSEAAVINEQLGGGQRMSKGATKQGTVIGFPRPVTDAVRDETVASIVDVLQEQLRFAREGKLRSVAVVSVSADGSSIGTQWSCSHGDAASLIGKLTVLTHDIMAARQ